MDEPQLNDGRLKFEGLQALRAKLETAQKNYAEAEASKKETAKRYHTEWQVARDAGHACPHDYAKQWLEYSRDFGKKASTAKAAVTRAKTALTIAETGLDPRDGNRPKNYTATLPCGRVVTRKSPRTYTHAVAALGKDGKGWWCEGWAGSESLAAARVRRLIGFGCKAQAFPVTVA